MTKIPSPDVLYWFAIQTGVIASILILQIKSTLPCLICSCLQSLGVRSKEFGFWPTKTFSRMTRDDWTDWSSTAGGNWAEVAIFHLLNCGFCFNFHTTWITSVVFFFAITQDPWTLISAPVAFVVSAVCLESA